MVYEFARKHNIKRSVVRRVAKGEFTYIHETTRGSLSVGTGTAVTEFGVSVYTTQVEKKHIPINGQAYMQGADVLLEARALFADFIVMNSATSNNANVIDISKIGNEERELTKFFVQMAYSVLTPIGVHLLDIQVRQFCAANNRPFWPVPWELAPMLLIIGVSHVKDNILKCLICGDPSHLAKICSVREMFYSQKDDAKTSNAKNNNKQANAKVQVDVCKKFMNRSGKCTFKKCAFSHVCTACQGKRTHKNNCNR